jgi:DNA-binding MarR family transcriptional regulator
VADPSDGRVSIVSITKEGTALVKKLRSRKNAYLSKRLRHLDEDELEVLERATAILERILEDPE